MSKKMFSVLFPKKVQKGRQNPAKNGYPDEKNYGYLSCLFIIRKNYIVQINKLKNAFYYCCC
jgi:hypothetical protein